MARSVCLPLSYVCVSLCLFVCLSVSASSFVCMFPSLSLQTSNSVSYGSQVWWIENQWKVTSFKSIFKMGFFSTPTSCTPSKAKLNFITCGRRPVISCSSQVQEAVSINSRLQWSQKIVTNAVVCLHGSQYEYGCGIAAFYCNSHQWLAGGYTFHNLVMMAVWIP